MGARGNSGVIISQMLRGFAHHVRHRCEIDTFVLATAMREAAAAARQALLRPVEGTILSVAEAAAEAAYKLALHERDFYRLGGGIVRAANEALDRTPDQLPVLKEARVVDSGGAGFVYFIEGILRFLPAVEARARRHFPRRPVRGKASSRRRKPSARTNFAPRFSFKMHSDRARSASSARTARRIVVGHRRAADDQSPYPHRRSASRAGYRGHDTGG